MTNEFLSKILDVFKFRDEYFATYSPGWNSSDSDEWFFLSVRGCIFSDQLDVLRELVYVSSISISHGNIVLTCKEIL